MQSIPVKPALVNKPAQELLLSGKALIELMQAVLAKGVPFRFCARGWSMTPFIRDGDVITIAPLSTGFPALGQVIAFVHPESNQLVVHRLIGRRGATWLFRGDNLPEYGDELAPLQNILGCVTRIERNGKIVRLSLGPERFLVALLSRFSLLFPVITRLRVLKGMMRKIIL